VITNPTNAPVEAERNGTGIVLDTTDPFTVAEIVRLNDVPARVGSEAATTDAVRPSGDDVTVAFDVSDVHVGLAVPAGTGTSFPLASTGIAKNVPV